jgi:hypothetical protein
MSSYIVTFRGHPACPCLAAWLPVYEAELRRRGLIKHSIDIYQLIGGAAASAGTHTRGGAYDLAQVSDLEIKIAREMGAAAWHRPAGWDSPGSIEHQHGVLNGCPHNTPARYQISAYLSGYNGLGRLGHGGRDTGPRVVPLRTWQEGIVWATALQAGPVDDAIAATKAAKTEVKKAKTAAKAKGQATRAERAAKALAKIKRGLGLLRKIGGQR